MNRRRFVSCALIPCIPSWATVGLSGDSAINGLLARLLAISLTQYEASDLILHPLAGVNRIKGHIDGRLNYKLLLK